VGDKMPYFQMKNKRTGQYVKFKITKKGSTIVGSKDTKYKGIKMKK